jgi:hypothetical protein
MTFPDVERAHHLKAKQTKKGLNPLHAVAKRNKRRRLLSHQHMMIPKSYGNPCFRPTLLLWKTVVPVWRQRVTAWNVLRFRRKCISCKPLHMPLLICFFCTHRRNPVLSLLQLSLQDARSRIARRRILCSRMWIPRVLFPRGARVLLDIVTSQRTLRRGGGYICIMLHVHCVSCLTGWTHLHSVQKPSASQVSLNCFHWRWRRQEASELVQLRSLLTPLPDRLGPRRSFKVRSLMCFSNFLRNF